MIHYTYYNALIYQQLQWLMIKIEKKTVLFDIKTDASQIQNNNFFVFINSHIYANCTMLCQSYNV